jgi:hypothetical protein
VAQGACGFRHPAFPGLNQCGAPGLEQQHTVSPTGRISVRFGTRRRSSLGRADASAAIAGYSHGTRLQTETAFIQSDTASPTCTRFFNTAWQTLKQLPPSSSLVSVYTLLHGQKLEDEVDPF